jgi:hypothetical protein
VEIEAKGAKAIAAIIDGLHAAEREDAEALTDNLRIMAVCIDDMTMSLSRMFGRWNFLFIKPSTCKKCVFSIRKM